ERDRRQQAVARHAERGRAVSGEEPRVTEETEDAEGPQDQADDDGPDPVHPEDRVSFVQLWVNGHEMSFLDGPRSLIAFSTRTPAGQTHVPRSQATSTPALACPGQ